MKKLDWHKKRTSVVQTLRRDSDGYEVLREQESGFVFRRKRQKLPSQPKSVSKKKSAKKTPPDLLPLADLLIDVLTPMMQREAEEFSSGVDDPVKSTKLLEFLTTFIERVLTPTSVLPLARAQSTLATKSGSAHEMLKQVCSPEIVKFVESVSQGVPDLESRLRRIAPNQSSAPTQTDVLRKKIKCLGIECAQWNELTGDSWPTEISLNAEPPISDLPTSISESDLELITKDRQRLALECMEVQQSITAAEELYIEAEQLFRDLQALHNHQEMSAVLVSDDPRILIKNLLAL